MTIALRFSAAAEGILDEAVIGRVVRSVNAELGPVFGKNGKPDLLRQLGGFNYSAAHGQPWIVVVDLDADAGCAPPARAAWLPDPAPLMCFRIAVREIESWLLADAETLADYLGVNAGRIPAAPDGIADPKLAMVELARRSRRRRVREEMVPRPGSGRQVGPAYASRLIAYSLSEWRPDVAAANSESLGRCIVRLHELVHLTRR
jgi:hypothetical protein